LKNLKDTTFAMLKKIVIHKEIKKLERVLSNTRGDNSLNKFDIAPNYFEENQDIQEDKQQANLSLQEELEFKL